MFNKADYRTNRLAGLRGQYQKPPEKPVPPAQVDTRITKKAFLNNTKRARKLQHNYDLIQLEEAE